MTEAGARGAQRIGRAFIAVLAAAAATSWMQFLVVSARREVFGYFSWKWWLRDQLFLSAAGYLLLFTALSLGPITVHAIWPRRYTFAALVASLAALGTFFVLLVFERISAVAWLVVAAGVGVQVYRAAKDRPHGAWLWTIRTALLGNLASVVIVGISMRVRTTTEADAMRALPAARPGAPNVVLLILDAVRAKSMSLYGASSKTTPKLEEWGRKGVVFDASYSTTSWTLPSHASMFTGRYPSQTSTGWKSPLDRTQPTLAEAFSSHGYATGGFVANIYYTTYRSGLARGFIRYEDSRLTLRQMLFGTTLVQSGSVLEALTTWEQSRWLTGALRRGLSERTLRPRSGLSKADDKSAEEVMRNFLAWLPSVQNRPFFAFLNVFDAHSPYHPPRRYRTMFDSSGLAYARYRGAIRYIDDSVDGLLRELDRRGILENTIVIITSDHGELFGENGKFMHGNALYRPQLHVPLVFLNAPGAVAGTRVRRQVSLRDLPATVLDLVSIPNDLGFGGSSLRPLLAGGDSLPQASPIVSELSRGSAFATSDVVRVDLKSVIDDSAHIIRSSADSFNVYAYPGDTAELHDLGSIAAVRAAARIRMDSVLKRVGIVWTRR